MIRLSPQIDLSLNCPSCQTSLVPHNWIHTGMRVVFENRCFNCKLEFYSEAPINSGLFYPGMLDAKTGKRIDKLPFDNWYLNGLVSAFKYRSGEDIGIKVIENKKLGSKPVLLLNTVDATYGHALYELFNASYYLDKKEFDLVIIVQKNLAWLVPDGAAQVWIADISFGKAQNWLSGMDRAVKPLLKGCNEIFVCKSFVQADSTDFDIQDYARIAPFPLEEWDGRLSKPVVTFIWRTDRFWRKILPGIINNRFTRKIFPGLINHLSNYFQFRWILRFSRAIKKEIPEIDFAIAGMDERKPSIPDWITDLRYPTHNDDTARQQLKRYADSHLVLGCNGSSLLLPGCLAGSVIDIVPGDQWAVSAGTFPFRLTSIGDMHYRYVLLPQEITIKRLVSIVVSILRDRSYVELQTSPPWRDHNSQLKPYAWSEQRVRAFNVSNNFSSGKGLITIPKSADA